MPQTALLNIKDALNRSSDWLSKSGIESARLDAELLLARVLKMSRLNLYLAWDRPLNEAEKEAYRILLKRRHDHEPVAYILGAREFYSRDFEVGPGVLVPRPETELLVENALRLLREAGLDDAPLRVAEVGVGSGAIAVTLALEAPNLLLTATDISERALDIARANALRHGVGERIGFHRASFLDGLDGPFDAVVSNPPYVAERDRALLPPDVRDHEPGEALFAGEDGLDAIRALIPTAAEKLRPGGFLLMEIGDGQAEAVCGLVDGTRVFDAPERLRDYRGVERMILARRKV